MAPRSFAGFLLLLLAAVSVVEVTMDVAAHPGVQRHQLRVRAQHSSALRLSQRSVPAVTVSFPAPPVLLSRGQVFPVDRPAPLPLVSASVFVPPRV